MTTVQSLLAGAFRLAVWMGLACTPVMAGCGWFQKDLVQPDVTQSPYQPTRANVLLAVAPPSNESGVSTFDPLAVGDDLVAAVTEARGLDAVPMNRTLSALATKGLTAIRTPQEAKALAQALGVDGVMVCSVTAYDPYDPPKMGLTLAIYMVDAENMTSLDPKAMEHAYTDQPAVSRTTFENRPTSTIVEHLDASNHEVLLDLKAYAKGRHDPKSALTWRSYTASMELYTKFATHHAVSRLLEQERARLGPVAAADTEGKDKK